MCDGRYTATFAASTCSLPLLLRVTPLSTMPLQPLTLHNNQQRSTSAEKVRRSTRSPRRRDGNHHEKSKQVRPALSIECFVIFLPPAFFRPILSCSLRHLTHPSPNDVDHPAPPDALLAAKNHKNTGPYESYCNLKCSRLLHLNSYKNSQKTRRNSKKKTKNTEQNKKN